jgi:hypothetical protein
MNKKEHWIIFDFDNELKKKNIYKCNSNVIFKNNGHVIIHKNIKNNGTKIDIFITYFRSTEWNMDLFVRGFLYKDSKEYEINSMIMFKSLQIEDCGYDRISLCKVPINIF